MKLQGKFVPARANSSFARSCTRARTSSDELGQDWLRWDIIWLGNPIHNIYYVSAMPERRLPASGKTPGAGSDKPPAKEWGVGRVAFFARIDAIRAEARPRMAVDGDLRSSQGTARHHLQRLLLACGAPCGRCPADPPADASRIIIGSEIGFARHPWRRRTHGRGSSLSRQSRGFIARSSDRGRIKLNMPDTALPEPSSTTRSKAGRLRTTLRAPQAMRLPPRARFTSSFRAKAALARRSSLPFWRSSIGKRQSALARNPGVRRIYRLCSYFQVFFD